jgi:hypothetical protein
MFGGEEMGRRIGELDSALRIPYHGKKWLPSIRSIPKEISMSIQLLARELYQLIREIEALERRIEATPQDRQAPLLDQLRKLRADRDRMRRMIDGGKGASEPQRRF